MLAHLVLVGSFVCRGPAAYTAIPSGVPAVSTTHMVASCGVEDALVQSALVSKWPDAIDIGVDIFKPGKAEKWSRERL